MRVEPTEIGSIIHCTKRGGRGLNIVRDKSDCWRFIRSLYYLNDAYFDQYWFRISDKQNQISDKKLGTGKIIFYRPDNWPPQNPLVNILAFTLLDNHFHLLLEEIKKDGISSFMQKLGQSMSNHFNEKYLTKGSIFQGSYRGKVVRDDKYLLWLAPYIMLKNTFEMHPKGYEWAVQNFDDAWLWAIKYPFTSLADYISGRQSPIVNPELLKRIIGRPDEFKRLCKDMIHGRENIVTSEDNGEMNDLISGQFE